MSTVPTLSHTPAASGAVWLARLLAASAFSFALALALVLAGAAAYELTYRGRIFPGVRAAGVDLSGLKPEEAALALAGAVAYPRETAFLLSDGQTQRAYTPAELGLTFEASATVLAAYQVGRAGGVFEAWSAQYAAWQAGREIAPVLALDEARLSAVLDGLAAETFRPALEAGLQAQGAEIVATPGQIGRRLDTAAAFATLREHLQRVEKAAVLLPFIETVPQVLDASAQAEAARQLLSQPLVLTITTPYVDDPGPWPIERDQLAGLLRITRVAEGVHAARFEITLDPAGLRALLEPLAEPLRREARNARFIFNDETRQLEVLQPSQADRLLDVEASLAAIQAAVATGAHTAALVFQITPPAAPDTATAADLGITELVSEQFTSFRGSSAERLKNIEVAAARFHGLLVPPGATFSFADNVGDISLDSGFAEALIIYGGRTIRGVGGGVCQVSTTLFRAVWFGGFPIVERNSHAYRVGYYEQRTADWAGPGLDAAVFTPLVDFKFQNDTPHWLLMETYFYPNAGQLVWKFYATADGRTVATSGPVVENVVPAPEPLYEENPELAAGEIKQVDYAAEGADVTVTRVVTRNGERINVGEAPLRTHYQPWRAIYQYGPGTPDIPGPTPTPAP